MGIRSDVEDSDFATADDFLAIDGTLDVSVALLFYDNVGSRDVLALSYLIEVYLSGVVQLIKKHPDNIDAQRILLKKLPVFFQQFKRLLEVIHMLKCFSEVEVLLEKVYLVTVFLGLVYLDALSLDIAK